VVLLWIAEIPAVGNAHVRLQKVQVRVTGEKSPEATCGRWHIDSASNLYFRFQIDMTNLG
jgi:hypothetical protein